MVLKKKKLYQQPEYGTLEYTRLQRNSLSWCKFCKYWDKTKEIITCGNENIKGYSIRTICVNLPGIHADMLRNYIYVQL